MPQCCAASVFPIPPPICHRHREIRSPKSTSSRVPTRGRRRIRFLGSVVATTRWTSSSLYVSVCRSPSTFCFVFFCAIASADNPTVRMSILSMLFLLMFLLLLALESSTLSQIVVLVINHSPLVYIVVLFLIVGINLCITKLLLFSTEPVRFKSCNTLSSGVLGNQPGLLWPCGSRGGSTQNLKFA